MTSQKKKVLYVITKSNWGGAQRYVYDLARHLPKDQFDVTVALGGEGELLQKLQNLNITISSLQNVQRDISITKDVGGFFALYSAIKRSKPDIVHLNSSKAGALGALAARIAHVSKIVFTVHGWPFQEKRNVLWRAFVWLASWVTALLCDKIICVSHADVDIAKKMPFIKNKAVLIYNGIEPMNLKSGEKIRRAFPAGVRVTGTIGELTQNKNHIQLIEEARTDPRMHVAIVGSGEDSTMLENKIKEYGLESRVKLFGFVPVEEALKGFDVFALPSLKEGLPYVLLEARAAGLPIVANRVGGVSEILDAKDMSEFSIEKMLEKTVVLYR